MKILCLDFDGVIHSYTSGWKGADVIPDPPVEGAAEFLHEAVEHFHVAVYSSRSHQPGGLEAMRAWCVRWLPGVGPAFVDKLEWPLEKPAAFVTLDDRALTFDGTWPTMQTLHDFKPWHRR